MPILFVYADCKMMNLWFVLRPFSLTWFQIENDWLSFWSSAGTATCTWIFVWNVYVGAKGWGDLVLMNSGQKWCASFFLPPADSVNGWLLYSGPFLLSSIQLAQSIAIRFIHNIFSLFVFYFLVTIFHSTNKITLFHQNAISFLSFTNS